MSPHRQPVPKGELVCCIVQSELDCLCACRQAERRKAILAANALPSKPMIRTPKGSRLGGSSLKSHALSRAATQQPAHYNVQPQADLAAK